MAAFFAEVCNREVLCFVLEISCCYFAKYELLGAQGCGGGLLIKTHSLTKTRNNCIQLMSIVQVNLHLFPSYFLVN